MIQSGDGGDGFFDGPRDGNLHLIDGRDAAIDADDDAWKVSGGEYRDRNAERKIHSKERDHDDYEENRFSVTRGPMFVKD